MGNKKILGIALLLLLFLAVPCIAQEEAEPFSSEEAAYIVSGIDGLPDLGNITVNIACNEWEPCKSRGLEEGFLFENNPSTVEFEFTIYNQFDTVANYYLAIRSYGEWELAMPIGSAEPYEEKTIAVPLDFEYTGLSRETDELAVIARSKWAGEKHEFSVIENWQPYEQLQATLLLFGIPVSIIIGFALLVFVALVTGFVFLRRKPSALIDKAKKYTLKSLFLPTLKGKPWKERISMLLVHPLFWAVEIIAGLVVIGIIFIEAIMGMGLETGLTVFFIGGICAMAAPIAYLFISWIVDWYEREPLRFIAAIFLWGVLAAFFSFFINTIIGFFIDLAFGITLGEAGVFLSMMVGAVIVAPIVEETSKGLGVAVLSANREMNDVLDGILYGFGIGLGFAAIENWLYFTSLGPGAIGGIGAWAFLIFNRSLFAALGHGWMTATTGAVIAFLKGRFRRHSYLYFIPAVILAMLLHGAFNFIAFIDGLISYFFGNPIPIFDPILVFGLTAIFGIIILFQLLKNRRELFGSKGKRK